MPVAGHISGNVLHVGRAVTCASTPIKKLPESVTIDRITPAVEPGGMIVGSSSGTSGSSNGGSKHLHITELLAEIEQHEVLITRVDIGSVDQDRQ